MNVGVAVLVLALAVATALGAARRRRDGRFEEGRVPEARQTAAAQAAAQGGAGESAGPERPRLTEQDLGRPLGGRATLVQFSSSFCAPCRATRLLLADVAARDDGVEHIEIDVAARLDLVRRLDVSRTPTVFVLGPGGQITRRASGVPRRPDVAAAVAWAAGDAAGNASSTDRE